MKRMRNRKWVILVSMAVALGFFLTGCGKKGLPVAPRGAAKPKAVNDLRKVINGNTLNLVWTIPEKIDESMPPLDGFTMYRFKASSTKSVCEECPIPFKSLADIPIVRKGPGDTMIYREKLVKGFRYFYHIRGYTAQGRKGRASNIVKFEFL